MNSGMIHVLHEAPITYATNYCVALLLPGLWLAEADANNGKVITEAAAAEINVFRIDRALRSAFIFVTL